MIDIFGRRRIAEIERKLKIAKERAERMEELYLAAHEENREISTLCDQLSASIIAKDEQIVLSAPGERKTPAPDAKEKERTNPKPEGCRECHLNPGTIACFESRRDFGCDFDKRRRYKA